MTRQLRPELHRGFSMVELMIAILIGSLILLGITSLFSTTSNVNRMENGLARLQENGRFAISRISSDIQRASGMRSMRKGVLGRVGHVHPDKSIRSFVDFGDPAFEQYGLPAAAGATPLYPITQAFMMRGYECGQAACAPLDIPGAVNNGGDHYGGGVPGMGGNDGDRAPGADVLTVRYLRGLGISAIYDDITGNINLTDSLTVGASGLIVIGDEQSNFILRVGTGSGVTFTPSGNIDDSNLVALQELSGDIRVNAFDEDFVTVTYYLRLSDDPSRPGRMISNLVRRENGQTQEIAQGIERLDFRYHVETPAGSVLVLDADSVDTSAGFTCLELDPVTQPGLPGSDAAFCGWRSVRAVEIYLLANTVDDAGTGEEPFQYAFLSNGSPNTTGIIEVACEAGCGAPNAITTLYSGLPAGRMLRREFRDVAVVRNNAY